MSTSTTTSTQQSGTPRDAARNAAAGWSAADESFFRVVRELFRPAFLAGATVLLASYDPASDATRQALVTPA